jgi:hypothetical protein
LRRLLATLFLAAPLQAQWRLEKVASTSADIDIGRVGEFVAGRGGDIFVADGKLQQIVVYDSTGRRARTIGRKGAGPLEFRALLGLGWMADTLVAYDRVNGIAFIAPDGKLLRTVRWPAKERPTIWMGAGGPRLFVVAYGNGRTVPLPPPREGFQNIRPPKSFLEMRSDTAVMLPWVADSTDDSYAPDCWIDPAKGIYILDEVLGGNGPFNAFTARGETAFLSADHTKLYAQSANQPARVIKEYAPLPVTDAIWNREAKEFVDLEKQHGKLTCSKPFVRPQTLPPIRAIAADDNGGFWVEVNTPAGSRYDLFDSTGRLAGSAPAPSRRVQWRGFVVRGDRLHVAEQDADDVVSIAVYRLRR